MTVHLSPPCLAEQRYPREEKSLGPRLGGDDREWGEIMSKAFLAKGNGHQVANRRKALEYVLAHIDGVAPVDERTVDFPPHGRCHFSAYTHPDGAMISTPGRGDEAFGSADWHARDKIMMFRDFGDGRCMIYVCPIKPLFDERTIGQHGVRWPDIQKHAEFKSVFRVE